MTIHYYTVKAAFIIFGNEKERAMALEIIYGGGWEIEGTTARGDSLIYWIVR